MLTEDKYFQTLSETELWDRYCGFLNLSMPEFMGIQRELLRDEIDRVSESELGRKIMGGRKPAGVDEFRRMVPLTTYDDYEPYLSEQRDDVLAVKPELWGHSAGRRGRFKWVPYSSEFLQQVNRCCIGAIMLAAAAGKRGRIKLWPGSRFLMIIPPPPYGSGSLFESLAKHFSFKPMPPRESAGTLGFQERVQKGFQMALRDRVDVMGGIGSVIVKIGEQMTGQAKNRKLSAAMLHPKVVYRVLRAGLRSRREKRPVLPRDLWSPKALMAGGMDTSLYKKDIEYYWGQEPYEFYICAEAFFLAVESWRKKGMIFVPDSAFLEFIPYESKGEQGTDGDRHPETVLVDQLEAGKLYEVVVTQFYGGPLLRYRTRDIIRVIALGDDEAGIGLPHITVQRRIGETINLAGLAELDEKTIWQAIENGGVRYTDWTAAKEFDGNQSFVHLYIEPRDQCQAAELAEVVDGQLKSIDVDYRDIDDYLSLQPVRVTPLSPGTFQRYAEEKQKEGADLAHMKPAHMNPAESALNHLLELSADIGEE